MEGSVIQVSCHLGWMNCPFKKIMIQKLLGQIQRVDYRLILEKRYISFYALEEIAMDLRYLVRNVQRMYSKTLQVVLGVLMMKQENPPETVGF